MLNNWLKVDFNVYNELCKLLITGDKVVFMKIKDVSKETGLTDSTIRYYDSLGLLGEVKRGKNNYRVFDSNDVRTLNFITESKELGFSLDEISEILDIKGKGSEPCTYVSDKIREKINLIDDHIKDLIRKKADLILHLEEGEAACG